MKIERTISKLNELRFYGMANQIEAFLDDPSMQPDSWQDAIGVLVDAEEHDRQQRRQQRLLSQAKVRFSEACIEKIVYPSARKLKKKQIASLANCDWISHAQNLIIVGTTGTGKSWLASAFAIQAIRKGYVVLYKRLLRLFEVLEGARMDGSLPRIRKGLAKADLLILDDWGLAPMTPESRLALLEVIEDQTGCGSIIVTSQLPVSQWHEYIGESTIADAILDRLVHRAHFIEPKGPSLRETLKLNEELSHE